MERLLSVVVVTRNSREVLSRCLASIAAQTLPEPPEVIVVDNGSTDGSTDLARRACPDARVIESPENRGYAWANNLGIDVASGRFVLLLNDDAWLAPDCAARLIDALTRNPGAGSASPRIYRDADRATLDSTGIVLNKRRLRPFDRGEGERAAGRFLDEEPVFGATGACAFYRKRSLAALAVAGEVFDEDFFAYYEDVDLAWRAQTLGWTCVYVPAAEAFHERRGPESKPAAIKKHFLVNRYFCYVKNEVGALAWRYLPWLLMWEAARLVRRLIAEPRLLGAVPLLVRLGPRMWRKRAWIQTRRTASSDTLSRFR
jgi:GT2 family glycosyltransferase